MSASGWTVGRRLLLAFAAAAATLLALAGLGYGGLRRLIDNDRWVEHSEKIRRDLSAEWASVTEAVAQERGYLVTGDPGYLGPYAAAAAKARSTEDDLGRLFADNPGQEGRLAALEPLVARRLGRLALELAARRGRAPRAGRAADARDDERAMDDIRTAIAGMDAAELGLLRERSAAAEASSRAERTVIAWGGLAGIALIGLIGALIAASLTRRVGSSVGRIQSSAQELRAAANQQASAAREQAASLGEISTTIGELLVTSRQIAGSAQRVARIAAEASAAADGGGRTVERCRDSMAAIRAQVDAVVAHMLELGRKSQRIGGVAEIITELSEQTNILSINAAVEAAGAGEHGRRFAAVAEEIRKLADRVGASTREVRSLIEEVRSALNAAVVATEGGSKAVETGTSQFSEVAGAFHGIAALVGTSREAAREIELSTQQQATAVDQVTVAVAGVAQASREGESGSAQILQTAGELSALASELARVIRSRPAGEA